MKTFCSLLVSIISIIVLANTAHAGEQDDILASRKINFNAGWIFRLGDYPKAFMTNFDDSTWEPVKLPHDWSVAGPIEKSNPSGRQGGFFPCGIGFYRKTFNVDPAWAGKQVTITFDGVMANSEVWINGHLLGKRPSGYVGFTYDLTPHLKKGKNCITVRADNEKQPASRWYTGCGIYRNVWLHVKNKISVAQHGTYVIAKNVTAESAQVLVETTIDTTAAKNAKVQLVSEIYNPAGKKIAERTDEQQVGKNKPAVINQKVDVANPSLWDLESPHLYTLVTKVMNGGRLVDVVKTPFGIRDIRFEVETGFWLNGKNIKVKGVNNHHDAGPVGAAVPLDVHIRRLKILKEMGCNAIRTAHNPFAPEFYDLCDQMGFLVMDEVFDEWIASWIWIKNLKDEGKVKYGYHHYFKEWWKKDLEAVILRDRNHPSIFLWSVGNEIPDQCYPEGPERLKPIMETVRALDTTREITCGCCFIHLANETGFASMLDVTGYNGGGGSVFFEKDKATYPNRKFIATEIPHSFQTRGIYRTHTVMRSPHQGIEVPNLTEEEAFPEVSEFYASSYDNASVRIGARDSWHRTAALPYVAGEFRWTGFDYLGEAIKGWPARFWDFGIIDLCGFPKDHYYFYQSQWTDEPMVHILPHWTWPGKEGKIIPVWTYSNADVVELFFNGESLGAKSNINQMNLSWDVPYAPGTLKAVAQTGGKVVAERIMKTALEPAKIQIIADRKTMPPDGVSCVHLEFNMLDKDGTFMPVADNLIKFNITGPADNIGVENGDALDLASAKINQRKMFNGKCLMILQSQDKEGVVKIEASADGLPTESIEIIITN
ncbi:glycoside hydrolase family 2 TIM barrel-domain containing protein [Pontiellaceae bacterium B12227]|nr:glycoside hydrolase family 2 TIM barrel-domain containing protein [Pontiellaceae bacterium B12227]